jgi:hypothetical protein
MNQAQMQPHVCFYGNKCPWSKAFIEELAKTPWKREFRFICVDPSPQRPPLPKWLQKVPTLVIKGEETPRTDSEVMNWIYERRLKEPGGGGGFQRSAVPSGEMEGYVANEMGSPSGYMYAPLDANFDPLNGDGGSMIPGTFEFLNGSQARGSQTAQQPGMTRAGTLPSGSAGGGPPRTKKEMAFDKDMEQYLRDRDVGIPQAGARQ